MNNKASILFHIFPTKRGLPHSFSPSYFFHNILLSSLFLYTQWMCSYLRILFIHSAFPHFTPQACSSISILSYPCSLLYLSLILNLTIMLRKNTSGTMMCDKSPSLIVQLYISMSLHTDNNIVGWRFFLMSLLTCSMSANYLVHQLVSLS